MTNDMPDSERLVVLERCDSLFAAEALVILLADHDIPATTDGASTHTVMGSKAAIPVPACVLVRESHLELARLTIQDARSDAAELDWEQVDVGERVDRFRIKQKPVEFPKWFQFVAVTAIIGIMLTLIAAVAWITFGK